MLIAKNVIELPFFGQECGWITLFPNSVINNF